MNPIPITLNLCGQKNTFTMFNSIIFEYSTLKLSQVFSRVESWPFCVETILL